MADKYNVNFGPGNTIGAMAVGPGATARGSVTIGGTAPQTETPLRMKLKVRGAMSRAQMIDWLTKALADIRAGTDTGAIGSVSFGGASGCSWTIEADGG